MPKIVSSQGKAAEQILFLKEAIAAVSQYIGEAEQAEGTDLDSLIFQSGCALVACSERIEDLEAQLSELEEENALLIEELSHADRKLDSILKTFSFDEALDEAVLVLMDGLISGGLASPTSSGEIIFDQRTYASRADLKPILLDALASWIDSKLSK